MAQTAAPRPLPEPPIAAEWTLPAGWRTLEFISDLHLQASEPATVQAFRQYLAATRADAVFLLGDLFEVWVGDDALLEPPPCARQPPARRCSSCRATATS